MKSIRLFLISVLFSAIAIIMFVSMMIGYQRSLQQTEILLDAELGEKYQIISSLLLHTAAGSTLVQALPKNSAIPNMNTAIYQVVDENNKIILQSGDFGNKPLISTTSGEKFFNFNGYRWHVLAKKQDELSVWIIVAERDDLRFRVADTIIVHILEPILIGLFLVMLLVWFIVRSGFKPIEILAKSIQERSASDLSEIPAENTPDELKRISASVNELFKRLDNSFDRERRFTSDAAHEMRNPITALKIHIDNLLDEFPEKNEALLKIKNAVDRLRNLVDQMLVLHRMSPDQYVANFSCINLKNVAQDVIAELYPDIEKKSQSIELDGPDCLIDADLFGIEVLIKNLVTNSIKYTPDHGNISIRLLDKSEEHDGVSIFIEDSGVGIADAEKQRVFDRFYRIGGDRHDSGTQGSGLGLSIVKHIVDLHQAKLDLEKSELGGLCVAIHFPKRRNCQ